MVFVDRRHRERRVRIAGERRKDLQTLLYWLPRPFSRRPSNDAGPAALDAETDRYGGTEPE
jgi:hypothetical protein